MRVENAGKHATVRAVLDQCSDVTLCTGHLLNRLEIKGTVKPFTVNTVNGRKTDDTSVQADLEVTSLDETNGFDSLMFAQSSTFLLTSPQLQVRND